MQGSISKDIFWRSTRLLDNNFVREIGCVMEGQYIDTEDLLNGANQCL